ncbi:MAG: phosphomethylpyrimidine synthase ThiC, partial [Candidatus Omnitrophota bacterium]
MTQLENAKKNILTPLVRSIARQESTSASTLSRTIKQGKAVILCNKKHTFKQPCAVGKGLSTKINANIGTSTDASGLKEELKKLDACVKYGADAVMDLSVG